MAGGDDATEQPAVEAPVATAEAVATATTGKNDENHATIWIAQLTTKQDEEEEESELGDEGGRRKWDLRRAFMASRIQSRILSQYPLIVKESKHGDLLEDARMAGYRSDGINMISKKKKNDDEDGDEEESYEDFQVIPLDFSVEEHGSVPHCFHTLTEFPLDYWEYPNLNVVALKEEDGSIDESVTKPSSYWHTDCALVKLGDSVREEATNIRVEKDRFNILKFDYQGKEYTIKYIDSFDKLYSEYNGLVYVQGPTSGAVEL